MTNIERELTFYRIAFRALQRLNWLSSALLSKQENQGLFEHISNHKTLSKLCCQALIARDADTQILKNNAIKVRKRPLSYETLFEYVCAKALRILSRSNNRGLG